MDRSAPSVPAASLSRASKVGYGTAEFGINAVEVCLRLHLLVFYTDVVGLRADLAGMAIALGILWDAVVDPLMGVISDHTRTRFGRRRPYILGGGFFLAIALVILFSPLSMSTNTGKFLYLLGSYALLNTFFTIISVPHGALAGDLIDDRNERTELFAWRLLFGNFGAIVGSIAPSYFLQHHALNPYVKGALVISACVVVAALITVLSTTEKVLPERAKGESYSLRQLAEPFRNRPFVILFVSYLVATLGLSLNSAAALYYYRQRLQLSEGQIQTILGVFLLVVSISIPAWVLISRRFGKKNPLIVGIFLLGFLGSVTYPFFPASQLLPVLIGASLIGGIFVGSVVLLDSMLADVVDYDSLRSGAERFGVYFGLWKMGGKAARALALAIAGWALVWAGVVPGAVLNFSTGGRLAFLFGPMVGIFFVLGALVAWVYPLTDEKHQRVLGLLARKKRLLLRNTHNLR